MRARLEKRVKAAEDHAHKEHYDFKHIAYKKEKPLYP